MFRGAAVVFGEEDLAVDTRFSGVWGRLWLRGVPIGMSDQRRYS
jgi:hypothetical protein